MAFSKITKDMNIIAALDDEPNDVGGLSAAQLKAKFDEGGLALKQFVNGTLIDELEAGAAAESIGALDANGHETNVQGELDNIRESIVSGTVPDGGITTAKLHDGAVTNAKLDDPAQTLVGSIAHSIRTDLGDKWALCNGDPYDPEEYPEFAAIWPKSIVPNDNPHQSTNIGSVGVQLYNGYFACDAGSHVSVAVCDDDGALIKTVAIADITLAAGAQIWGIDHNGAEYVFFIKMGNTAVDIYTSADLTTYTRVKQVTNLATDGNSNLPLGVGAIGLKYDGTYYYYMRGGSGSSPYEIAIFDNSYDLVREISLVTGGYLVLFPCEHRVYAAWYKTIDGVSYVGVKQINGDVPTSFDDYRQTTLSSSSMQYHNLIAFNDDYDLLYFSQYLRFIPRDGTSAIKAYDIGTGREIVFVDGYDEKLLACGTSNYYYLPTDAEDPSQSSAWVGPISFPSSTSWGYFGAWNYRYKTTCMIQSNKILRYPFLPTFASSGYYTYIKVKE